MPPVWLFRDEAASVAVCKMLRCLQSKNHPGAKRTRRGNSSSIDLTCYRLVPWASSTSPREFGTCAVSCTFLSPAAFGRREQSPSGTEAVPRSAQTGWCWEEKCRERHFLVQSRFGVRGAPLSPLDRDRTTPGRCCSPWGWEVQLSQGAQNEGVWAGPHVPDSFLSQRRQPGWEQSKQILLGFSGFLKFYFN